MKNVINVDVKNCQTISEATLANLLEVIFKEIGGSDNGFPYLYKMENHVPEKDFYSGGILSKNFGVLLDYVPSMSHIQLTLLSSKEVNEGIKTSIMRKLPECSIET